MNLTYFQRISVFCNAKFLVKLNTFLPIGAPKSLILELNFGLSYAKVANMEKTLILILMIMTTPLLADNGDLTSSIDSISAIRGLTIKPVGGDFKAPTPTRDEFGLKKRETDYLSRTEEREFKPRHECSRLLSGGGINFKDQSYTYNHDDQKIRVKIGEDNLEMLVDHGCADDVAAKRVSASSRITVNKSGEYSYGVSFPLYGFRTGTYSK